MRPTGVPEIDIPAGERLQRRANLQSDFRKWGGVVAGFTLGYFGPSWPLAAGVATLAATDYSDGKDARNGAELLGRPTSEEGSEKDHWADKCFQYAMMVGMASREVVDRNFGQAGFIATAATAIAIRDVGMAAERRRGHNAGKDTKAQLLGKLKTNALMSADIIGSSPLVKTQKGKLARNALLTAGTGLAGLSYLSFRRQMRA